MSGMAGKLKSVVAALKKRLPLVVYGLFLAGWLLVALVHFIGDGLRPEQALFLANAATENLQPVGENAFISDNTDPQLIFTGLEARVRLVRFRATFAIEPGEMELFYSKNPEGGFSASKRVIGIPQADGSYLYQLPAGRVGALRIDPGTAGGNAIEIDEITLNPALGPAAYFLPSLRDVMFLIWVPLLVLAVAKTLGLVAGRLKPTGDGQEGSKGR